MLARIWKIFGGREEFPGERVVELEFTDGRKVQLSAGGEGPLYSPEAGLLLLRVWPAGGFEAHGNITDLSMSFHIGDEGVEIRNLQTRHFRRATTPEIKGEFDESIKVEGVF